ncbi:MAG: FtsX-like permease family protein [Bacteroidia bacterium]|nr:FtsX-like permease family protein [Bacteroidia bacterium]
MLLQIAWRNIWRNPLRSGVVITAVVLGLWAVIFMLAFSFGMTESRTRDILETQISHIQLHNHKFEREDPGRFFLEDGTQIMEDLENDPATIEATSRYLANAILNSTKGRKGTYPVQLLGVNSEKEAKVTSLEDRIIYGTYLSNPGRRIPEIIMGKRLAENVGVLKEDSLGNWEFDPKRKLTLNNIVLADGSNAAIRVKVVGIYKAQNSALEALQVFMNKEDLLGKLNIEGEIHEIAVLLENGKLTAKSKKDSIKNVLLAQGKDTKVESWNEIAPEIEMIDKQFDSSMRIMIGVILLALGFGIVNTMLMAILERTRELGMLMSIGMNKRKVFSMVMLETMLLTMLGAPIGIFLSYLSIWFSSRTGIDLSGLDTQSMSEFGMSSILYPALPLNYYLEITVMVVIAALISSIFPAFRAIRLRPAEAVRAI